MKERWWHPTAIGTVTPLVVFVYNLTANGVRTWRLHLAVLLTMLTVFYVIDVVFRLIQRKLRDGYWH